MLDSSDSSSHIIGKHEHWKSRVYEPIDPSNAFKWKDSMDCQTAQRTSLICHQGIVHYDYSAPVLPHKIISAYGLNRQKAEDYEKEIGTLTNQKIYLDPISLTANVLSQQLKKEVVIFSVVSGNNRFERVINSVTFICSLIVAKLRRKKIMYVDDVFQDTDGPTSRVSAYAVQKIGYPVDWNDLSEA